MTQRALVAAALDDLVKLSKLRFLARRARLAKLYFQLRADDVPRGRAKAIVRRTRAAIPGLKSEPAANAVAVDLILAK